MRTCRRSSTSLTGARLACAFVLVLSAASVGTTSPRGRPADVLFRGLHVTFGRGPSVRSVALGDFTRDGPVAQSLTPVSSRLRAFAFDSRSKTSYALTRHDFGTIDAGSGKLAKIEVEGMSWPAGIAVAEPDRQVWVSSASGAGGFLHAYHVDTGRFSLVKLGQTRLTALAYDGESRSLYGFPEESRGLSVDRLIQLNSRGAVVGDVKLSEPIPPIRLSDALVQMAASSGRLYLLVSTPVPHPRLSATRLYQISVPDGRVEVLPFGRQPGLTEKLWPGMPDGPTPFDAEADCCLYSPPSNYQTPARLTATQREELHVISVLRGDRTALKSLLESIESVRLESSGRVRVSVNLDEKLPPPVEVHVGRSSKPVVLALSAAQPVTWVVQKDAGARLSRVFLTGRKGQTVVGLSEDVEVVDRATSDGFGRPPMCAPAWELELNAHGAFDRFMPKLRKLTKLRESSFQGCAEGKRFTVPLR